MNSMVEPLFAAYHLDDMWDVNESRSETVRGVEETVTDRVCPLSAGAVCGDHHTKYYHMRSYDYHL
jgi:hypothetical protein